MSVPRFCPACATPLSERVLDGLPRPACSACDYIHFDNPVAVAGVIIRRGNQVLLVRQPQGSHHVLVSGFLEAFESAEDAAVREVQEETGLKVEVERVLGTYSCRPIDKNMVFIVCLARLVAGDLHLSEELIGALVPIRCPPGLAAGMARRPRLRRPPANERAAKYAMTMKDRSNLCILRVSAVQFRAGCSRRAVA